MTLKRLFPRLHFPLLTAEGRAELMVQIYFVVAASILVTLALKTKRELLATEEREHLQLFLRAWYIWPLAVPPGALFLIRQFPILEGKIVRHALKIACGSLLLYIAIVSLRFFVCRLPNFWLPEAAHLPLDWNHYFVSLLITLPLDFVTFIGLFSASFAIDYHFQHKRKMEETQQLKLRSVLLESNLARAELSALRGHLQPHFLFNSFNAVSALVRQGRNDAAVEVISQLSSLLRLAIERTSQQELRLEQEIDFIRRYLEIEQVRFADKLRFEIAVEAAALETVVPNLILQPLVENAIKHGIAQRTRPGEVLISVRRAGDRMQIEVCNDGPDHPPGKASATEGGFGLVNIRARLEKFLGADYRLDLLARPDGGMNVRLDLPWRLKSTADLAV